MRKFMIHGYMRIGQPLLTNWFYLGTRKNEILEVSTLDDDYYLRWWILVEEAMDCQ